MKNVILAVLMGLLCAGTVFAQNSQSDAIVSGEVVALEKVAHLTDEEGLWLATIEVEDVVKEHDLVDEDTIEVYFLWNGEQGDDSPRHVELMQGEKAEFHLEARPLMEDRDVLFLENQEDVKS